MKISAEINALKAELHDLVDEFSHIVDHRDSLKESFDWTKEAIHAEHEINQQIRDIAIRTNKLQLKIKQKQQQH